ncbi:YqcI/YcgG family protein [Halobacillus sp. BBL2006]|uniref:YqcI/YcgG family protein n=1 Tax=Halobacillus sp. BBL2006 TaxID=1543706 RepID=UPI0005426D54|nr:YqcI/YcgG family protein [Halobacillus sp. BBL2006]KHE68232.1 hypothetical protein LD39_15005 [Halobacillus sp. BBL2006]
MFLCTKSWIEKNKGELDSWKRSAFEQFSTMMIDKENPYPCVPGIQGFVKDMLRFGFSGDPRKETSAEQLAQLLKAYGKVSRETGPYASLVVFFDSRTLDDQVDTGGYQRIFWELLNKVHEYDDQPWPDCIPESPSHNEWEFCFDQEPYFTFCATPAHTQRKSRHFPFFLLAFQPRWVFEKINASTTLGNKLKDIIRKRLVSFDETNPHPDLKWYGQEDNYEWKQYFLNDDSSSPANCPFMTLKNRLKSLRS